MNLSRSTRLLVMLGLTAAIPFWLEAGPSSQDDAAARAEHRAVVFLTREVPDWFRNNACYSCHNNGDAARALYNAAGKGLKVPSNALADTTAWLSKPARWSENKGDPAFSDKRLANIQFAAALLEAVEAGFLQSAEPLELAAKLVAADQGSNGAWTIEIENALGSPVTWGTELATWMALQALKKSDSPRVKDAVQRGQRRLRETKGHGTPSVAALLLQEASDPGGSLGRQAELLRLIRSAQAQDGGWGPFADSPSEPFDTAVALLALRHWRDDPGTREAIRKGRRFLVATQNPDGSWPATTRPPNGNSYAQLVSTTAWSLIALLETRE
jgi:hypothetical protein